MQRKPSAVTETWNRDLHEAVKKGGNKGDAFIVCIETFLKVLGGYLIIAAASFIHSPLYRSITLTNIYI